MKITGSVRNWAVALVLSLPLGCGATAPDTASDDKPEQVGSSSAAITATGSGLTYANQCLANHVPTPPTFDNAHVLPAGQSQYNKWSQLGDASFSFIGLEPGKVYVAKTNNAGTEGLCVILGRYGQGTGAGQFDAICQGKTGNACFWEGTHVNYPTDTAFYVTSLDGGTALDSPSHVPCTTCHAGKNVFISHNGVAGDGLNGAQFAATDWWMPQVAWYTPIVPAGWPENPGPAGSSEYPSACTSCHSAAGTAGQLPSLRYTGFAGTRYCKILNQVITASASQGGMPPGSCTGPGPCPMASDPEVKAMLAACGNPMPYTAVSTALSPAALIGTGAGASYAGNWEHAFMGVDVGGVSKMYLYDNKYNNGSYSGWSAGNDYTSTLLSSYRPTMWLRDGDGSKLSLASTDYTGKITEKQFGGATRTVSASGAAGSPFGYIRNDGINTIVFRGTDSYIYESVWSGGTWTTSKITSTPAQPPTVLALGDPIAYNRGTTSSVIYKCGNMICELRRSSAGAWTFRDIPVGTAYLPPPISGNSMPVPFKRAGSSDYMIFYAADDGLHLIWDPTEPGFGDTIDLLLYSGHLLSSPAPYNSQDGGVRVAFISDSGYSSSVTEAVLPPNTTANDASHWYSSERVNYQHSTQQLTGDPAAYKSFLTRNTIIFRNTANTVYQLQTTTSGAGEVGYARTTIQKGYHINTTSSVTQNVEQTWGNYLPPGEYKFDLTPSSGDPDLYVKLNDTPTTTVYDCRPFAGGLSAESCTVTIPGPNYGYMNVMVRGYATGTSGFTLRGYFNDGG